MKSNRFIITTILFFLSNSISAQNDIFLNKNSQYGLIFDLGWSKTRDIGEYTAFPLGYSTFIYNPLKKTNYPARYGATFSKIIKGSEKNLLQVGLSYHQIQRMNVDGKLYQGISPPYYMSSYSYRIRSAQLLAEGKWLHEFHHRYFPYLIGGAGVAFNKAQDFTTSIPDYLTVTPSYGNHSNMPFSYTIGLGLDYLLTPNISVGLGYRFSDLGTVKLGAGYIRNTKVPISPSQPHLYLNTLLVSVNCFL
ncbi:outer membrane protein [Legionella nagasakiensis]|uniref:outer membrane protein n=1 Tax=Legionella nagasakiensis TaxID=535290 RepID=UPI00105627CB|nr:porin family protein [Legionella nagasakiensis]